MSRRIWRTLVTVLAVGLAWSLGTAALAAPVGTLKQFKVPTANSQPRAIANGSATAGSPRAPSSQALPPRLVASRRPVP
jgi:hypothetical protein